MQLDTLHIQIFKGAPVAQFYKAMLFLSDFEWFQLNQFHVLISYHIQMREEESPQIQSYKLQNPQQRSIDRSKLPRKNFVPHRLQVLSDCQHSELQINKIWQKAQRDLSQTQYEEQYSFQRQIKGKRKNIQFLKNSIIFNLEQQQWAQKQIADIPHSIQVWEQMKQKTNRRIEKLKIKILKLTEQLNQAEKDIDKEEIQKSINQVNNKIDYHEKHIRDVQRYQNQQKAQQQEGKQSLKKLKEQELQLEADLSKEQKELSEQLTNYLIGKAKTKYWKKERKVFSQAGNSIKRCFILSDFE